MRAASKLFQQLSLAFVELDGRLDNDRDHQITTSAALQNGHAFSFDRQLIAALRSRRDLELVFAFKRGNLQLRSQRSLRK